MTFQIARDANTDRPQWADFWRDAALDGCTEGLPDALRAAIAERWQSLFNDLAPDTEILDIGCGRGAVLAHARSAGLTRLHGIDTALIADTFFPLHTGDAASLPFADRRFDVITSQFGIEYAGLAAAVVEAGRVSAKNLWLLVHAAEGPLHADALEQIAQAALLTGPLATFDRLAAHFEMPTPASVADIDALRAAIVDRAAAARNTSLLEGIWRAISALQDVPDPLEGTRALAASLTAHATRLRAMADAAPTDAEVTAAADHLRATGFDVSIESLGAPPAGRWLLATRRPS